MDISKSLFGLLKNNGLFKSEKQAKFLTNFLANDLTYYTSFSYNLGSEYNFKPCGSSSFVFFCDNRGVYKVVKTTSTNKTSVYFERLSDKAFKEKQNKLALEKATRLQNRKELDRLLEIQDRYEIAICTCVKLLIIKEFKELSLDKNTIDAFIRIYPNKLNTDDGKAQKEKHYNINSRYTNLYNKYINVIRQVENFEWIY